MEGKKIPLSQRMLQRWLLMKMVEVGKITLKGGKREDRCVLSAGLNEFDEFSTKKHRITDAWHREFVSVC
jgi:hypothetical protein